MSLRTVSVARSTTLVAACLACFLVLAIGAGSASAGALAVDYDCFGEEPTPATDCGVFVTGEPATNVIAAQPAANGHVLFSESGPNASAISIPQSDEPEGGCHNVTDTSVDCPAPVGSGANMISGRIGDDTVNLSPGTTYVTRVFGDSGNDVLHAKDGNVQTIIDCGDGAADVAFVDANDAVPVGCESVNPLVTATLTPTPTPAAAPATDVDGDGVPDASDGCPAGAGPASGSGCPANAFRFSGKAQLRKGFTTMSVTVPGAGVLKAAQARVTKKKPALIRAVRVRASKAGKVSLKLKPTAAGKKVLAKKGKLKVSAKFTFTPTGGKPKTTVKPVVVARVKFIR